MCFSLGGGAKKHEVETQSASLGRDFAIHKVLPLLITGDTKEGRGELHDFNITLLYCMCFSVLGCYGP